jgi:hypothetical protein
MTESSFASAFLITASAARQQRIARPQQPT